MKTTMTLSANMGCTMFDLFNQETDEVIMTINFYLILGEEETPEQTTPTTKMQRAKKAQKQERIRVNDATATGGWW